MAANRKHIQLRADAHYRLERDMDAMVVSREERLLGRKLFDEEVSRPNRSGYGVIINRVTRALQASRQASTDASARQA